MHLTIEASFQERAHAVRELGQYLRRQLYGAGGSWTDVKGDGSVMENSRYRVERLEEDSDGTPGGTTGFDGQALAFIVYDKRGDYERELRVVVEDVTLDAVVLGDESP